MKEIYMQKMHKLINIIQVRKLGFEEPFNYAASRDEVIGYIILTSENNGAFSGSFVKV